MGGGRVLPYPVSSFRRGFRTHRHAIQHIKYTIPLLSAWAIHDFCQKNEMRLAILFY